MSCERCELHTTYLERIVRMQNEQIEYLKNLHLPKKFIQKVVKEISNSIYDIIDHNIDKLNICIFIERIEKNYPASEPMNQIISEIISHEEYTLLSREKSNLIKYLNKENNIIYSEIETFSIELCNYIFINIKQIVHDNFIDTNNNELLILRENNRVQNLMLLKDPKFCVNAISQIIKRLEL